MTDTTAPDAITQADIDARDAWFAGDRDPRSLAEAFAAHRRLAAHGAGEGLREALRQIANNNWKDTSRCRFVARQALATDAGSTRREGGEGVPKTAEDHNREYWSGECSGCTLPRRDCECN